MSAVSFAEPFIVVPGSLAAEVLEGVRARFMKRVEVRPDGCWMWLSGQGSTRYGNFSINDRGRAAHRVAYELFVCPIPQGLQL